MTIEEFEELCFEFGVELDDVTSEREMALKQTASSAGTGAPGPLSDRTILKIDVSANRYDLLCHEGLARALRVFLGVEKPPNFVTKPAKLQLNVKSEVDQIRPFVVAAVLRDIEFTQESYDSFIELQEKLHQGLCRRRTKVAIGTHDLDTIQGPFTYEALAPEDIKFTPLNQKEEMDGHRLMEFYAQDKRLSKFLPIIKDSPIYPVIYDNKRRVCSLPPIINGDHSKIRLTTKNVFIECTATDEHKAHIVLNLMVTMFSQYCKNKFEVEQVEVVYEKDGRKVLCPNLEPQKMTASVKYINSCVGTAKPLTYTEIAEFLTKMGMLTKQTDADTIQVSIPPYRTDILHQCDIMEDVAVAYGINNIPKSVPRTSTVGGPFPLNKLGDMIRREVAFAGWSEVLPLTLCSHDENYPFLRKKDPGNEAVTLANPQTAEYQLVRTSLLPGMLKTLNANKKSALPIKLFEVGDIVLQDTQADRRARNERHLCAMYCNKTSGMELIHGLLDRVMAMLNIPFAPKEGYSIKESSLPTYFPGRQAEVLYQGHVIGAFGIVHPEVLEKFEIPYPVSILEINVEPFL